MKNKISRRDFIGNTALVSAAMMMPGFLRATGNNLAAFNGKRLIIVQLTGGNDGLNTIIPYSNDLYYSNRPDIGIKPADLIRLNDDLAFNPALESLIDLWEQGSMSILNNVGYPNPNRSHFRSRDIWQSASDENQVINSGWIGRTFDSQCTDGHCTLPHNAIEIDSSLSLVLRGEKFNGLAMDKPNELAQGLNNPVIKTFSSLDINNISTNHNFLYKEMVDTFQSAEYVVSKSKIYSSKILYPQTEFSKGLKVVSELIVSGSETKVYYLSLNGFDTHVSQNAFHPKQLRILSQGINALYNDLKQNNEWNNTLVVVYSEFGRRVKQNGARGTDHGTANNVLLFGGNLNKLGIVNELPNLNDLQDGDLKHTIDFRSVYATVLKKWLEVNPSVILGREFPLLDFIV
ncbi:hypothetical protein LBMAG27_08880 [Bacteroidota bacterium]|nr:hypothetical protein LBMAG27_08880 [Bacteroidota bacterium]